MNNYLYNGGNAITPTSELVNANYIWDPVGLAWVAQTATNGSSANPAAGATGTTIPVDASYTAFNSGGNLVGVSSSNPLPVAGTLTIGSLAAGTNTIGSVKVTDGTSTATLLNLTNNKAISVGIVDGSGNQITSFGSSFTQYTDGTTNSTPTGAVSLGKNPSNILHALSLDSSGNLNVNLAAGSISGGNAAASTTGTSVPSNASYTGFNSSGNLVGVSTANPLPVAQQGSVAVTGTFWQTTQPVSGTLAISSLPALPAGSNAIGSVSVSNFPGTQPVSIASAAPVKPDGTVWTLSSTSANVNVTNTVPVSGTFWQATQPVSGSVSLTGSVPSGTNTIGAVNINGTVPVSGTFWQTTQPVSLASTTITGTVATNADANINSGTAPLKAIIVGGVYNSSAPAPSAGQTLALQTDASGNLKVNITNTVPVSGTFWQTTQPVSIASMPTTPVTGTFWQTTQPVSGTFWQATQPVSLASLPALATGSNTIGAVNVNGTVPVSGTFWQSTQPVSQTSSGSVGAGTAGTTSNLAGGVYNSTALTLTNGQQSALQLDANGYLKVNVTTGGGGGSNAAASATGSTVPSSADYIGFSSSGNLVGVSTSNPLPVAQQGSVAVTGTFWQTTQPVSLASLPSLAAGSAAIGSVITGGAVAVNTASSGNPEYHGGIAVVATNPTKATNAQRTGLATDAIGRMITVASHGREQVGIQQTTITSSTTETTIITAAASTFNDITHLSITNSSATATIVTLKDSTGGTVRAIYSLAAGGGININFNPPIPQATVNTNWTITCGTSVASVYVNAVYVKNI